MGSYYYRSRRVDSRPLGINLRPLEPDSRVVDYRSISRVEQNCADNPRTYKLEIDEDFRSRTSL